MSSLPYILLELTYNCRKSRTNENTSNSRLGNRHHPRHRIAFQEEVQDHSCTREGILELDRSASKPKHQAIVVKVEDNECAVREKELLQKGHGNIS